jgi:hypothetical protein
MRDINEERYRKETELQKMMEEEEMDPLSDAEVSVGPIITPFDEQE